MTIATRLTAALADRYRIERELGAGGMATVYLANDLRHQRQVAIEVIRSELAAGLGTERFLRSAAEARALVARGIAEHEPYFQFAKSPAWAPFRADPEGAAMLNRLGF